MRPSSSPASRGRGGRQIGTRLGPGRAGVIDGEGTWRGRETPRRSAPYDEEPGFYAPGGLWLYGNARLLRARLFLAAAAQVGQDRSEGDLRRMEAEAEERALGGEVLVCGIHGPAHRRSAVVPLRWGAPRIVVMPGGFLSHLGPDLADEPFREARLWRRAWDPSTDLAVSRRAPDAPPGRVQGLRLDRLIRGLSEGGHTARATYADPFGLGELRRR